MWSAQQHAMLNAMGYTLYERQRECSLAETLGSGESPPSSAAGISGIDSTLFKAVLKAARGKDLAPLGIDMNALRSSPHAKRALWPQIRKLMKS